MTLLTTRRKVMLGVGVAITGSAVAGGWYWKKRRKFLPLRTQTGDALVRDYRVAPPSGSLPEFVVGSGVADAAALVEKVLAAMGGMGRFVSRGDVVVIKPNMAWNRSPVHAANTNPDVVAAVVRAALNAGAKRVVVAEAPCDSYDQSFERSGIAKKATESGAEVVLPTPDRFRDYAVKGQLIDTWPMLEPIMSADKVINVPVAKRHGMAKFTGAMKNWYGLLGGERNRLHGHIDISIADLARFIRPTLNIVDATRVLVRNGPKGGNLDDVVEKNTIIASTDPVAADAYGCTLVDLRPDQVAYLHLAEEWKVGTAVWKSLRHAMV